LNQGLGPINDDIKKQKPNARTKAALTAEELPWKFGDCRRTFTAAKKDTGFDTRMREGETGLPGNGDEVWMASRQPWTEG
jgi:hypothetical protein